MAKKTKKTKKVKVAQLGEAHIQATFNNIIISLCNNFKLIILIVMNYINLISCISY